MAHDDQHLQAVGRRIAAGRLERGGVEMFLLRRHARQATGIAAVDHYARAGGLSCRAGPPQQRSGRTQRDDDADDQRRSEFHARGLVRAAPDRRTGPQ